MACEIITDPVKGREVASAAASRQFAFPVTIFADRTNLVYRPRLQTAEIRDSEGTAIHVVLGAASLTVKPHPRVNSSAASMDFTCHVIAMEGKCPITDSPVTIRPRGPSAAGTLLRVLMATLIVFAASDNLVADDN